MAKQNDELGEIVRRYMHKERRSHGHWTKMSDEDLIHYVRSWHYEDRIIEFQKSRDSSAYAQCLKRGLTDSLVEEGTLIREKEQNGFWKKPANIDSKLKAIIAKIRHFPNSVDLRKLGENSMLRFIERNGGFYAIREKMGYSNNGRAWGYWKKFENVEAKLRPIIRELGHFPSQNELQVAGHTAITNALARYHGGINNARRRMGYEPSTSGKDKTYWKNWANVEAKLRPIIEELGHFPTSDELKERELFGLIRAMKELYGGVNNVRARLGEEIIQQDSRYWRRFENLETELKPIIEKLGYFPTNEKLRAYKRSDIANAISRYHGGFPAVKKKIISKRQQEVA